MSYLVGFGRFWWSFIIGDDWLSAAGVGVALGVTAAVATWWILPPAVALLLAGSLFRATAHS